MKKLSKFALSLTSIGAIVAPVATAVSCGSKPTYGWKGTGKLKDVYGTTDGGNVKDKSFNNQSFDAVKAATGDEKHFMESTGSNKTALLSAYSAAATSGATTIVGAGFYHVDAMTAALTDHGYDGINFILLDGEVKNDRVLSINFQTAQVGFEAGYAAAKYAAAHKNAAGDNEAKIGTFGGGKMNPVTDYMYGFVKGLKFWNSKVTGDQKVKLVQPKTLFMATFGPEGSQDGTKLVTQTANKFIADGVDVIFPVGGPQQATVAKAIKDSAHADVRVIGVDADYAQQADADLKPFVLTSALKNIATVTTAAFETIFKDEIATAAKKPSDNLPSLYAKINDATKAKFADGTFGKSVIGGLAENFVGIPTADEATVLGTADEIKAVKDAAATVTADAADNYKAFAETEANWN